MNLAKSLGQRIRRLREERGITQETLAYTSDGISSKGYLSDIEAGRKLPSLIVLQGIAKRLEVEPFDLLVFPEHSPRERVADLLRSAEEQTLHEIEGRLTGTS